MRNDKVPLLTTIEKEGQRYIDKPIYRFVMPDRIAYAVRSAFSRDPIMPIRILERYEHTRLVWPNLK